MNETVLFDFEEVILNEDGSLTVVLSWAGDEDLALDAGEE